MTNTIYIHQPEKAFSFTRLPNFLCEAPTFKPLSNEAKVLYAFILRRTELSRKNGWADDCGRIYLYYSKKLKKKLLLNAPYVLFVYLFDKAAQGIRLAPGADASQKLLHLADGFGSAFASPLPSFHPIDLLIGFAGAVIMWVVVYVRGKNAKKFRKNTEYGSARWGTPEDIEPYMDPDFRNNIILTRTERLTMNSRPKDPKTARNKNVLVIGGSGSGKTRFFVKPQLMQLHSSYVVTDPKGSLLVECGRLMERA